MVICDVYSFRQYQFCSPRIQSYGNFARVYVCCDFIRIHPSVLLLSSQLEYCILGNKHIGCGILKALVLLEILNSFTLRKVTSQKRRCRL